MPTGSCNCGAVKVTVADSAFPKESVLCRDFTVNLVIPTKEIEIQGEGNVKVYEDGNTDSGHTAVRKFCATCGSAILTGVKEAPDNSYVKGGLFSIGTVPGPKMEIFKKNFEQWENGHEGAHVA
ncbi:hypothetical protein JCM10212_001421 [Sporobolomyces blumeae]